ncbi:MAG TPA: P-loop NTPase, partial [Smithellaceae bacterium]|nr:P-loop NTPase [Smithellaceae bacterium]
VIENMSGFACPKCGEVTHILPSGAGRKITADMGVPFLGSIPMDPAIAQAGDSGQAFIHQYASSPSARILHDIIDKIVKSINANKLNK